MRRKSPQEKKELEYTKDHFTPGRNSSARVFARSWRRKKTHANRQYRHKSQELLAGMKPGMSEDDLIPHDLTAARFQKSVTRKRLQKQGTVTLGEKVNVKLQKRAAIAGRKSRTKRAAEIWARSTIATLNALQGERFVEVAERVAVLCHLSADERQRLLSSQDPVDQALCFLHRISYGSAHEVYALCRNPELHKGFETWLNKAAKVAPRTQKRKRTD